MIAFEEAPPRPVSESRRTIVVDGNVIGECEPRDCGGHTMWHAVIRLPQCHGLNASLVQGHGNDPLSAVRDGIYRARLTRDAYIRELANLERQLGTEGEALEDLEGECHGR